MKKMASIEYVPCVLKLDKGKFACYVEQFIGRVPPLHMASKGVKILSHRKKAWRAALAMARVLNKKISKAGAR